MSGTTNPTSVGQITLSPELTNLIAQGHATGGDFATTFLVNTDLSDIGFAESAPQCNTHYHFTGTSLLLYSRTPLEDWRTLETAD